MSAKKGSTEGHGVELIIENHRRDGRLSSDPTALLRAFSVEPNVDSLTLSDIFVRELFQNILDLASDPDEGNYDVVAEVEEVTLGSEALNAIRKAIGGEETLARLVKYRELLSRTGGTSGFRDLIEGDQVVCTIVSDHTSASLSEKKGMHGTTDPKFYGLPEDGSKTTFERYVLASGYPDKLHRGSVGGHGIGKIANTLASKDNFVVVYTYTNEESGKEAGIHKCVCVGFDEHVDEASRGSGEALKLYGSTTGAMYVGHPHSVSGSDGVRETRGEVAKALAASFGIEPRADGDYGTSICVFNSRVRLEELRRSYHRWFFPAHYLVKVPPSIRFCAREWGARGPRKWQSIHFADFPELSPYIRAYSLAMRAEEPDDNLGEKRIPMRGGKGFPSSSSPGSIAFSIFEDFDDEDPARNKIALTRQFLVVNYVKPTDVRGAVVKNFAGAYVIGDAQDIRDALAAAEPPKHHTWSPESSRLDATQKIIVEGISSRIKQAYSKFVSELLPDERFKDKKNRELSHALGRILSNRKGPSRDVTRLPSELHITQKVVNQTSLGEFNTFSIKVSAQLSDKFDPKKHTFPISVKVTPSFHPVGAVSREALPIRFPGQEGFLKRASRLIEITNSAEVVEFDVETKTAAPEIELTVAAEIQ